MNPWLAKEVRDVVAAVQRLHASGAGDVWLHFRRGGVVACCERDIEGFELVTSLSVPRGKSESDLTDWVRTQIEKVPCCP